MVDTLRPSPEVIASWPEPNFVDPENKGPALVYICIIFGVLGVITCVARLYSRLFITRAPGVDDVLIIFSLLLGIALSVMVIIGNKVYFSGHHVWDIPISRFSGHRLNVWISMWCYVSSSAFVKISVLLFYRRLSVKFSKVFLVATWVGIVYNLLYMAAFALALLLTCDPVYAYWMSFDPVWASTHSFRCKTEGTSLPAAAGLSVLGDLYSTLLPMFLIYGLDLPRRQKVALYSLFAFGFLAAAAGLVRTVLLYRMLNSNYDFTFILWDTWIWAIVELYVGILAASAPALKPFFRKFLVGSIGSVALNKGHGVWFPSHRGWKGKRTSQDSSLPGSVDLGKIGVAYSGTAEEVRQRGFFRDIGNQETRNLQMRKSADGKMIPIQVHRSHLDKPLAALPITTDSQRASGATSSYQWTDSWPMPPTQAVHYSSRHTSGTQRGSQQTIQVGLQLDPPIQYAAVPTIPQGFFGSGSLHNQHYGIEYDSGMLNDSLRVGSRLESASVSDQASISRSSDERPPWNTIKTSSSIGQTERSDSDSTLHLPRMGSRAFDPEKKSALKPGMPVGYAI